MIMQRRVASLKPYRKAVLVPAKTPVTKLVQYYERQNTLSHLCVIDEHNELLGLISRKTVFRTLFHCADFHQTPEQALPASLDDLTAAAIMQKRFVSVSEHTTLKTALDLCLRHHLHELPVLAADSRLLGFITTSGIARHWYRAAHYRT